jgi:hypothetical protein
MKHSRSCRWQARDDLEPRRHFSNGTGFLLDALLWLVGRNGLLHCFEAFAEFLCWSSLATVASSGATFFTLGLVADSRVFLFLQHKIRISPQGPSLCFVVGNHAVLWSVVCSLLAPPSSSSKVLIV